LSWASVAFMGSGASSGRIQSGSAYRDLTEFSG
jgi:hypothetical protein